MERNLLFKDFVLLLFSTLIISGVVGTTTTQKPKEEVTKTLSMFCGDPCFSCDTNSSQCLQRCDDGYVYVPDLTTMSETTTTTPTTTPTTITTTIAMTTTTTAATPEGTVTLVHLRNQGKETSSNGSGQHPSCRKCIDEISNCKECFLNENGTVYCSVCSDGYSISNSMTECTGSSSSEFPDWAIAVIVVLSVLVLAGIGVTIFFVVRRYKAEKPRTPPPLPAAQNL